MDLKIKESQENKRGILTKINRWVLIKLTIFCTAKEIIKIKQKDNLQNWRKQLQMIQPTRG